MTVRPGFYGSSINASAILGVAAGRNQAINNSSFGVFCAARILYTATATVGNRQLVFRLLDPGANIIWQNVFAAIITASQVVNITLMTGQTNQNISGPPIQQIIGLPIEMPIPQFATFTLLDNANVDVNDAFTNNMVYAM